MKSVQIVTSAYNEEDNVIELYSRISNVLSSESNYTWELLFFDNASTDSTWKHISQIAQMDPRVKGFRMTRTFTLDVALSAGIDFATADIVVTMASDLQDLPELIPNFLRKFEDGYDFVVARVNKRAQINLNMKLYTKAYYKLATWITDGLLLENVSDFRLMSKNMYRVVQKMDEQHRFLRGLTAWTGFQPAYIETERPARNAGKSKTRFAPVFKLALRGILAHTDKPINMISWFGLFLPVVVSLGFFVALISWIFNGVPFSGFGTIIGLQLICFALTTFFLGIIAQYAGLIYMEVKQRPHFVLRDTTEGIE